jgi:biotin carboxylase
VQLAQLREHFGIAGVKVATAELFRDKARMKDALRAAGLPCARHALVSSLAGARAFVETVGYPIVVKPPAGMACKATWRIDGDEQLAQAVTAVGASEADPLLAEEFLRGREHSFDTITIGGEVMMTSVADYAPSCLEVMEHDWIQWAVVMPRESGDAGEVAALGRGAIAALGLDTAMTHMEWFRRDDGSLAIGEIAARPPGAHFVRMMGIAHETSMYRGWARAVVDEAFDGPFERRFAVGCAYLRGMGRGRVIAIDGAAAAQERVGSLVVEAKLPTPGAPKNDSYEGDGHVILRHADTAVVRDAVRQVIETVRVRYG